jgi:fatty-acyl-CoA synthase
MIPTLPNRDALGERIREDIRLSLWDVLIRTAEAHPDRQAVVMGGAAMSYRELVGAALRAASALSDLGVGRGTRVASLFHTGPDWAVFHYALMRLGALAVPVNLTYEQRELTWLLERTRPDLLVSIRRFEKFDCESKLVAVGEAAAAALLLDVDEGGRVVPGGRAHDAVFGNAATIPLGLTGEVGGDDPAYIVFTSGSTAFPKGALCPHRAFTGSAAGYVHCLRMGPDDRFIGMMTSFHVTGPVFLAVAHGCGAAIHLTGTFETTRVLDEIERGRCTSTVGFPTNLTKLAGDPTFAGRDLSTFKKACVGGTPLYLEHLREIFGFDVLATPYGSTESGSALSLTDPDDTDPQGPFHSNGRVLPGATVRILDPETGRHCGPEEPGEICFGGWPRFLGYLPATAPDGDSIDAEGLFHSGDYGFLDAEGRLCYRGRYKMMIKTGGENVSELELEMFLEEELAQVAQAQVVGVPDPTWGEEVVAFVELRDPAARPSSEELRALCRGRIAGFKIPKRFLLMSKSDWPLTSSGKMDKQALRRLAAGLPEGR